MPPSSSGTPARRISFRDRYSPASRRREYERACSTSEGCVPSVLEPHGTATPVLDKEKFLLPVDLSGAQLIYVVRKRLLLKPSEGLFLFCRGTMITGGSTVRELRSKYACQEDGFLYVTYSLENVFGRGACLAHRTRCVSVHSAAHPAAHSSSRSASGAALLRASPTVRMAAMHTIDIREDPSFSDVDWEGLQDMQACIILRTGRMSDGTLVLVVRVLKTDVSDEVWSVGMRNMRRFLHRTKERNLRYHFVFDLHLCETLPVNRVYDMHGLLHRKRELMKISLHSTAMLTNSKTVEMIMNTAIGVIGTTRPMRIFLAPKDTCAGTAPPVGDWDDVARFFTQHRLAPR
jgi:GABA(A) receptor-associated protein